MAERKVNIYLISVVLFMLVLPLFSIFIDCSHYGISPDLQLAGKWLIFWGIGARLFIAGIRQVTKPAFTARQIFNMNSSESFPVIRELGFANICLGTIAFLSLWRPDWRLPAAVVGGLYFGLAGMMHVFKKPATRNEWIALLSDLYLFVLMVIYCVSTL